MYRTEILNLLKLKFELYDISQKLTDLSSHYDSYRQIEFIESWISDIDDIVNKLIHVQSS
jgi:hypothetical protein